MNALTKTLALTLASWGMMAGNASALITIDTVPVGDINNPPDWGPGYGSVGYSYAIGKYEVTLNQYCSFLNAVGATDTYGLYNTYLGLVRQVDGIARQGAPGSYRYSVMGSGNRPVTYVSWFGAARFANWLQNGQPTGLQGPGTTETGAYTLNGATSGVDFTRNAGVQYVLPSEDEWYKAAYYDPSGSSGNGGYWLYPTRSNTQPNSRNGSTSDPNSANYYSDDGIANGHDGGYAVNNSTSLPSGNALTDVGAFSLAHSFYGTFDQAGNAYEWTDGVADGGRVVRGGSWNTQDGGYAGLTSSTDPTTDGWDNGFRVAIIPEPSVGAMMVTGIALLAWKRKHTGQAIVP